jgi:hypothetical protein
MADDLQNKLNAILGNPEMMKAISSFAGGLGQSEDNNSSLGDMDLSGIQNIVSSMNNGSDSRINLLNALKPYMRKSRADNMDMAIRIIKLTKLTSLLKDI